MGSVTVPYLSQNPWQVLMGGSLKRWKSKLALSRSQLVILSHIGDSMSQPGFGGCTYAQCWPVRLITALQALYGDGGSGFLSVVNSPAGQFSGAQAVGQYITQGGTVNTWSQQIGIAAVPNGCTVTTTGAIAAGSHIMTWPNTVLRGRFLDIYYGKLGTATSFNYSVDGGGNVLVTPAIGAGYGYVTVDTGVAGPHSVVCTTAAADSGMVMCGVSGRNSTGVLLHNMALWGRSVASIGAADARIVSLVPDAINAPALALYMLGINDTTSAEALSAFFANSEVLLDASNAQNCDSFVVCENGGTGDNGKHTSFTQVLRTVANEYNASQLDLWQYGGRDPAWLANNNLTPVGDFHPNPAFCQIIANLLLPPLASLAAV